MLFNLLFSMALTPTGVLQQPKLSYITEAGIDSDGNIYVASDDGRALRVASGTHCIEAKFANDRQTVGCSIARGTKAEETMQSLRLEIYMKNGKKQIIGTETPIMEWHFWRDGQQISVCPRVRWTEKSATSSTTQPVAVWLTS